MVVQQTAKIVQRRGIALLLAMLFCLLPAALGAFSVSSSAMYQSEFDEKIQQLQKKYPTDSLWTGSFEGGIQCFGFANLMAYETFGTSPNQWETSYTLDGVKQGDVLRYGYSNGVGHSVYVIKVKGDEITCVDCNGMGGKDTVYWGLILSKSAGTCFGRPFYYRQCAPQVNQSLRNSGSYFMVNGTNLTGRGNETVNIGSSLTFLAKFSGGEGTISYKCMWKKTTDSSWKVIQDYNSRITKFTVGAPSAGRYAVKLIGRDQNRKTASVDIFYNVIDRKLTNKNTQLKVAETGIVGKTDLVVPQGQTVVVMPDLDGGYGNVRYKYMWKKTTDTAWTVLQDYNAKADSLRIPAAVTGDYVVKVIGRDAKSNTASADLRYTVKFFPVENNGSDVSGQYVKVSNPLNFTVKKNVPMVFTAKFKGGIGQLKYKYMFKKSTDSEWSVLQDYSAAAKSYTIKASYTGRYFVKIIARDSKGNTASADFRYTVSSANLKNRHSTLMDPTEPPIYSTTIEQGDGVSCFPDFTGGVGELYYSYYLKSPGKPFEEVYPYSYDYWTYDDNCYEGVYMYFDDPGTYTLRVKAMDAVGNIAGRDFTIKVK